MSQELMKIIPHIDTPSRTSPCPAPPCWSDPSPRHLRESHRAAQRGSSQSYWQQYFTLEIVKLFAHLNPWIPTISLSSSRSWGRMLTDWFLMRDRRTGPSPYICSSYFLNITTSKFLKQTLIYNKIFKRFYSKHHVVNLLLPEYLKELVFVPVILHHVDDTCTLFTVRFENWRKPSI